MSVTKFDKSEIRVIGFDLDQTLYPKSSIIDQAIQEYIYQQIAINKNCPLDQAAKLFTDLYQEGKGLSGRKVLLQLGFSPIAADQIVQTAVEKTDITKLLTPNPQSVLLLRKIRAKFQGLDLITGSTKPVTHAKLARLNIESTVFSNIITGETSKSDGTAFRIWLEMYPELQPTQFLYIGDREKTDYFVPLELGMQAILVNINSPNPEIKGLQLATLYELEGHLI